MKHPVTYLISHNGKFGPFEKRCPWVRPPLWVRQCLQSGCKRLPFKYLNIYFIEELTLLLEHLRSTLKKERNSSIRIAVDTALIYFYCVQYHSYEFNGYDVNINTKKKIKQRLLTLRANVRKIESRRKSFSIEKRKFTEISDEEQHYALSKLWTEIFMNYNLRITDDKKLMLIPKHKAKFRKVNLNFSKEEKERWNKDVSDNVELVESFAKMKDYQIMNVMEPNNAA